MIGPSPLALPSGAPRMMKFAKVVALAALPRMVTAPRTPSWSLIVIQNASRPIAMRRLGSNTMPTVPDFDFSGLRLGVPPVMVGNWLVQSDGAPGGAFRQRRGS